tara:strand:- start:384 stop:551 length:168 start_codon:yes stop_codon:yes gene_type:complete
MFNRGDKNRNYELVLPKHQIGSLQHTPQETSEAIAYELVLLGLIESQIAIQCSNV